MAQADNTSSKENDDEENRKLYVECLGQLVGITFKPGTELKEVLEVPRKQYEVDKAQIDPYIIRNISTENSKNWKAGVLSVYLKKLGYDPNGKKVHCADPLQPTVEEIMPSLIFPQKVDKSVSFGNSSLKRNVDALNGNSDDQQLQNDKKRLKQDSKENNSVNDSKYMKSDINAPFRCPQAKKTDKQNQQFRQYVPSPSSSVGDIAEPNDLPSLFTATNNQKQQLGNKFQQSSSFGAGESDDDTNGQENITLPSGFQTASTMLRIQDKAKGIKRDWTSNNPNPNEHRGFRGPGMYKSDLIKARNNFAGKLQKSENDKKQPEPEKKEIDGDGETNLKDLDPETVELLQHPQLKNFDPKLVLSILSEVMQPPQVTKWEDIAGLVEPKKIINEVIIWPMLRPEIFNGLRAPAKGILLFGPPGTGKTMIGRVIASVSKSTFFNISASSLTSKWIGEGEKLVRCLFQLARIKQPSVVFIDEIDSILTARSDTEHESSRRMKTEFLVQFDGAGTTAEDRVLVIGVTNRPQELDEAARRRLVKRIYIPLPDIDGRVQIVKNLMKDQRAKLSEDDFRKIGRESEGFSGADMKSLCQDASYGPIREIIDELETITPERVRDIEFKDFKQAFKHVKSSVADTDLSIYEDWDFKFGSHARQ